MGFSSDQWAKSSAILKVGGAVTGGIGAYYSAKNQVSNLKFQADMAGINARISELGARQELFKGQQQVGAASMKAGQVKSSQRAAMAANGIDLGEGTAAEIQATTDLVKEIDMATLEANAVRSAWGYRTQGVNYQNDALMRSATARTISPYASAATSLLGSAGSVATSWYNYQRNKEGAK